MDPEAVNLYELIERNRRGRSWRRMGRELGQSDNTIRGWAKGQSPFPEFRARAIAEWISLDAPEPVTPQQVLDAAAESRRVVEEGGTVGAIRNSSPTAARAVGERATPMQIAAAERFIRAQQKALDIQRRAQERAFEAQQKALDEFREALAADD